MLRNSPHCRNAVYTYLTNDVFDNTVGVLTTIKTVGLVASQYCTVSTNTLHDSKIPNVQRVHQLLPNLVSSS